MYAPSSIFIHLIQYVQATKKGELLLSDVKSLTSKVKVLQENKDELYQSVKTLEKTLEDERRQHCSSINNLENGILASIREKFSSLK